MLWSEKEIDELIKNVHRDFIELKNLLEKTPRMLTNAQKEKLERFDRDLRAAALFLVGAGKGMLSQYRRGRFDRSHWWWYLDDILQEEAMAKSHEASEVMYADVVNAKRRLAKVAEDRVVYQRKVKTKK